MTPRRTSDKIITPCFMLSTVIHVTVFLLMSWWGVLFPPDLTVRETYYVDVVNLPVASPRAGSPTQRGDGQESPGVAVSQRMTTPQTASGKETAKSPAVSRTDQYDPLSKALAKVQNKAEAQQAEAAIERLRSGGRGSGTGRSGMPGAFGTEAGSSYEAYIKSRLEDALAQTISYSSRRPEVRIRLFIAANGQLSRQKVEYSSGDTVFEIAVRNAIERARRDFRPTPNRKPFEGGFSFKPQGVSNRK